LRQSFSPSPLGGALQRNVKQNKQMIVILREYPILFGYSIVNVISDRQPVVVILYRFTWIIEIIFDVRFVLSNVLCVFMTKKSPQEVIK
jgi:hypothetical protein